MSKFRRFLLLLREPGKLFLMLSGKGFFHWMPDKAFLRIAYFLAFGQKLDLRNPETFSGKMQWLKLYNRDPAYSTMVDKYEVRKIISNLIGEEYLVPILGLWKNADEIDPKTLPNQFVLKCTHDSGSVLICRDKRDFNFTEAKEELNQHLKKNPFWFGREWPYKNVVPRIMAEQYLENENQQLIDYKFMCFRGKAKCCFVFSDRYSESGMRLNVYNREWELLPVGREYTSLNPDIMKPRNYDTMIQFAEIISEGIPFVRVDFYEAKEKLYFGETTFFPNSGLTRFKPPEWDEIFGSWIELPQNTKKE